jgi:hypothetical protein
VAAFSSAQQTDCITQECFSAINYPADLTGKPDSRATTWGLADAVVVPNKFIVPSGYRVRILRFEGNFIAWPRGVCAPANHVGVSWGLKSTAPDSSVHIAAIADQSAGQADNCFAYFHCAIGGDRGRIARTGPSNEWRTGNFSQ